MMTRRLFSAMIPGAAAAASTYGVSLASQVHPYAPYPPVPSSMLDVPTPVKDYAEYQARRIKLLKAMLNGEEDEDDFRRRMRDMKVELAEGDIAALRSVSPAVKARMAERRRKKVYDEYNRWEWMQELDSLLK